MLNTSLSLFLRQGAGGKNCPAATKDFPNLFFQPYLEKEGTVGLLNKRKKRSRDTYEPNINRK